MTRLTATALTLALAAARPAAIQSDTADPGGEATAGCPPVYTALFTPLHPRLGRYEACPTAEPIEALADRGWTIAEVTPTDAFGATGMYDRGALARLYGGRRPQVARGWRLRGRLLEAITLVSPYPDPALTRLREGTLVIRFVIGTETPDAEAGSR